MASDTTENLPFLHGPGTDTGVLDTPIFPLTERKKKKKKKKVVFDESNLSGEMDPPEADSVSQEKENKMPPGEETDVVVEDLQSLQTDFFPNKKKKKKKRVDLWDAEEREECKTESSSRGLWTQNEREYTYTELLTRISDLIKEKNPELKRGQKSQLVLKPPQVLRRGAMVVLVNFIQICQSLHRSPKHVQSFMFTELGSTGSLNGKNHLNIRGRYKPQHLEAVIRNYVKGYVVCKTCRSFDTTLQKESKTRLLFVCCDSCASKRCVSKELN